MMNDTTGADVWANTIFARHWRKLCGMRYDELRKFVDQTLGPILTNRRELAAITIELNKLVKELALPAEPKRSSRLYR